MPQTREERNRKARERYADKKSKTILTKQRRAKKAASERERYARNKVKIKHQRTANKYIKKFTVSSDGYTSVVHRVKITTKKTKSSNKTKKVKVTTYKPKEIIIEKPEIVKISSLRRPPSLTSVFKIRIGEDFGGDDSNAFYEYHVDKIHKGMRTFESFMDEYKDFIPNNMGEDDGVVTHFILKDHDYKHPVQATHVLYNSNIGSWEKKKWKNGVRIE